MKIMLFANTDWYLYNFRRSLARELRDKGYDVLLVSPHGGYGEKLQALGFSWIAAPMQRRSLNPLRELMLLLWLRRLMKQERVDLVHGFTLKCVIYGAVAARLARVEACVSAVTGMGYVFTNEDKKARLLRPLVRLLMRLGLGGKRARLILQNPDDEALFNRARLVNPAIIRLIAGSGVDCERFTPRVPDERGARFRVVLPARLLWDKGLAEYVAAARLLIGQGRAIDFLLAGTPDDGNPASVSEDQLQAWADEGCITLLGHVDDMPALFRAVDAVALPSYREGLPKGLIEAAACALPLVCTDATGCREVVDHEINGLLVPIGDAEALAQAIAWLQDDPALCQRLGQAARKKALMLFDERIVIRQTLDVYHELLGAR